MLNTANNRHTHTHLTALFPRLPRWAGTRKVKPIWILLKQETVSGISWVICKSAPRSRQITTPTPHHSVFYRPDALPAAQPCQSTEGKITDNVYIILIYCIINCVLLEKFCLDEYKYHTIKTTLIKVQQKPAHNWNDSRHCWACRHMLIPYNGNVECTVIL